MLWACPPELLRLWQLPSNFSALSPGLSFTSRCGLSTWPSASAPKAGHVIVRACGLAALGLTVHRRFAVGWGKEGQMVHIQLLSQQNLWATNLASRGGCRRAGPGAGPVQYSVLRPVISHALSTCSVRSHRYSSTLDMALSLRKSCRCTWGEIDTEISYSTSPERRATETVLCELAPD